MDLSLVTQHKQERQTQRGLAPASWLNSMQLGVIQAAKIVIDVTC
jgi:hypothetical protein